MIKICCDICMKEMKNRSAQPDNWCVCDIHLPFAQQFYAEQADAIRKTIEAHRNRFLQTVVNRPRPLEKVNA